MPGAMESTSKIDWGSAFWCCFYGCGLIGTLGLYGILQERIMTKPYSGGAMFAASAFLVFSNRVFNCIYASSMLVWNKETFENKAPIWKYMVISLSNVAATMCQYECLKYVSFPVQMLGKSFKMMPVMLWGMAISGKQHTMLDWLVAACVTGGVTEFLMTGPTAAPNDKANSVWGLALLVCFLACDGLTSTMQEKMFKEHKTSKFNQMLYVNGCSGIVSFITVCAGGNLLSSLSFCGAHARFVLDVCLLSSAAAGSQFFIYSQVKEFGALVFAATMNVRQVVSILLSYATYDHYITGFQVIGLTTVFGALFYKSYNGLTKPAAPKKEADEKSSLIPKSGDELSKDDPKKPGDDRLPSVQNPIRASCADKNIKEACSPRSEFPKAKPTY